MKLKALAAAACMTAAMATTGFASTFTVLGIDYDVSVIEGSFADNTSILEDQVWFGNIGLARSFSLAITDQLGGFNNFGPLFAHSTDGSLVEVEAWDLAGSFSSGFLVDFSRVETYAIATPISAVPLPAGGLLLLSGLAFVAGVKRRKTKAA